MKEDLKQYMDYPRLIVKNIQGEITREEKVRLEGWLAECENNRELYEKICKRENVACRAEIIQRLHKGERWKRVNRATGGQGRMLFVKIAKYAAVIVVPVLVGVFCFQLFKEEPRRIVVQEIKKEIKPGEMKAELVLAGGQSLILGAGLQDSLTNEGGVDIVKEGEGISYRGDKSVKALAYNTMRVPRGGEFKIKLQDGTVVYLNSESQLRYPVQFTGKERRVYLSGEAYFEVEHDEQKPFIVEMGESEIEVLGTEFNARSYSDEDSQYTTLVSGKVSLTTKGEKSIKLLPGEQGIITGDQIKKENVDVFTYTAWKDGDFVFRKQRLDEIMSIVERWYDVRVVFMDDWCRGVSFSGNVRRYDGFNRLVEMLETTGSVKFEIKENVIYMTRR